MTREQEISLNKEFDKLTEMVMMDEIREKLTVNGKRLRFNMSGYDDCGSDDHRDWYGECKRHNNMILNLFADEGIYDATTFIALDFYKGSGTFYYQIWGDNETIEVDFSTYTTAQIIYEIIKIANDIKKAGFGQRRIRDKELFSSFTGEHKELKEIYYNCYVDSCEKVFKETKGYFEDWMSYDMYTDDWFEAIITENEGLDSIEDVIDDIDDDELRRVKGEYYKHIEQRKELFDKRWN